MEVKGQLKENSSLPAPSESQGSDSGHQGWWQVPVPAEPSSCPLSSILLFYNANDLESSSTQSCRLLCFVLFCRRKMEGVLLSWRAWGSEWGKD